MAEDDGKYLGELRAEKESIDPAFVHAVRLINEEIERTKNPKKIENQKEKILQDVTSGKPVKVECDIRVPKEDYPSINFVGRLIGPGGSTMKGIQEVTNTRMAVLGEGSVREKDKKRLQENSKTGDLSHLKYPLHVHISALGPLPQAYMSLGSACAEIQKLLQIDEDTEAQFAAAQGMMPGRGRGSMNSPGRGRGVRGAPRGRFQHGGPGSRGSAGNNRGMRGMGSRGIVRGVARGNMRGAGRGQQSQFNKMKAVTAAAETYSDDYGYDSYSNAGASSAASSGFDNAGYGDYDESYDATYEAEAAAYGEGGYGDSFDGYGYGGDGYDSYGNGASNAKTPSYGQGPFRGKVGGRGMRGRQKPY